MNGFDPLIRQKARLKLPPHIQDMMRSSGVPIIGDSTVGASNTDTPSLAQMLGAAGSAIVKFARSGFPPTDTETLTVREAICKSCDLWESAAFGGTGRCKKCGCSTWAKLRMSSEKCPLDKW